MFDVSGTASGTPPSMPEEKGGTHQAQPDGDHGGLALLGTRHEKRRGGGGGGGGLQELYYSTFQRIQ